jgi:hypothetical protein
MVTGTVEEGPAAGVPMQKCSVCGDWWPKSHAYFHKRGKGFDSRCKDCKHAARVNFKDTVTDIDAAKYLNQRPVDRPQEKPHA